MYSNKPLIFVVISVLVVALVYSSYASYVLAAPKDPKYGSTADCNQSTLETGLLAEVCCWTETDPADPEQIEIEKCQICADPKGDNSFDDCGEVHSARTTPPRSGEGVLPQDGVLEQPPTPPPTGPAAPLQDGVLERPPATPQQPTPPTAGERVLPPCPPGEVTTANCIPQATGDESEGEPPAEEEQQPSEEEGDGSSEDNDDAADDDN